LSLLLSSLLQMQHSKRDRTHIAAAPAHYIVAVAVDVDARSPVCAHNKFAADAAQKETAVTSPPLLHITSSPSPLPSSPPMLTRAVLCAH
jgi:hypothetical protein